MLERKETLIELRFLESVTNVFQSFLTFFQREEPLIHVLHDQMCELLRKIMGRYMKIDSISLEDLIKTKCKSAEKFLDFETIDIGMATKDLLKKQKQTIPFLIKMRQFLMTICEYLQEKLPSENEILKSAKCLQPEEKKSSHTTIQLLAQKVKVDNVNSDLLGDEWRSYQSHEWRIQDENEKPIRIDRYWNEVFHAKDALGNIKYPNLTKVVKSTLMLSHGNSDVERAFSESGSQVTKMRASLSSTSVNGLRATYDGLKQFGGRPEVVKITPELLRFGRSAHQHYVQRIAEENRQAEKEKQEKEEEKFRKEALKKAEQELQHDNQKIQNSEQRLAEKEIQQKETFEVGDTLLQQGNDRLRKGLQEKNLMEIALAQAMIETAQQKLHSAKEDFLSTRKEQRKVQKRKQAMIDSYILSKKAK